MLRRRVRHFKSAHIRRLSHRRPVPPTRRRRPRRRTSRESPPCQEPPDRKCSRLCATIGGSARGKAVLRGRAWTFKSAHLRLSNRRPVPATSRRRPRQRNRHPAARRPRLWRSQSSLRRTRRRCPTETFFICSIDQAVGFRAFRWSPERMVKIMSGADSCGRCAQTLGCPSWATMKSARWTHIVTLFW